MRVLVATDGSPAAAVGLEAASDIVARAGGEIRIVAVVPTPAELLGAPRPITEASGRRSLPVSAARALLVTRLDRERGLVPNHLSASTVILEGHPAGAIVAEARRWPADLVVVGARGHSVLETIVLGSTSEEVVDRSPVPVLVARMPTFEGIALAVDGSEAAAAGVDLLADPVWRGTRIWVIDVAPTSRPWWVGMAAADATNLEELLQLTQKAAAEDRAAAEAATTRLRDLGIEANSCHRVGDPAAQLIDAAYGAGADTIVIGSRGQTGLSRLVLGSVTRQVLRHSTTSVLVVHPGLHPWKVLSAGEPMATTAGELAAARP